METKVNQEKQTYSKALIKQLKRNIKPAREKILKEDDINDIFKYIVREVFGFNKEHEIANLKIVEKSYCYLGVQIDGEIIYIIEYRSPKLNLGNGSPNQTFEYGAKHNSEWIIRTNGIDWEIYRSNCDNPDEYNLVCVFNFLKLNLENEVDLNHLFLLCKEAHIKTPTTDQFNRYQWFGFLSEDKKKIEYMFLVNYCLYEDGSAKFHIPLLDLTYRCVEGLVARRNAVKAIEKYLLNEYGKVYDNDHQFVTVAYYKETEYMKSNSPVWW